MATSDRIPLADGILTWARKTAGYDIAGASHRLAITAERLTDWEAGKSFPTITQLRNLAKLYKRPLAVLLLPEPPTEFSVLKDYRKLSTDENRDWSPALHAEYKRALTQREVVLELAELSPASINDSQAEFSVDPNASAETAAATLRKLLKMDSWSRTVRSNPGAALNTAIGAIEQLGILVLHTRDVDIAEMRALSIPEWPHPVILLNGSDWPRPRLFSLLHELTHLAIQSGGICDLHEVRQPSAADDVIENFCNQVAASVIMPKKEIEQDQAIASTTKWTLENLAAISTRFGASSEAFLLRLIGLGLVDWSVYRDLKPKLDAAYAEARAFQKARAKDAKGGPSFYVVKARNLGPGYVHSVLDAFYSRAISSFDVADYLDVKFNQVPKLQEALR